MLSLIHIFYELVGEKVAQWGEEHVGQSGYSYIGAVVGATYPETVSYTHLDRLGPD